MKNLQRYWHTWLGLDSNSRGRFVRASVVLILIKIGLAVLPFSLFRRIYGWMSSSSRQGELPEAYKQSIVWAVDTAANLLPFEILCLPRALAAKYFLRNLSATTLEVGIEVNPRNGFEAHAWVERNGEVIIGDWPDSITYQRLWVWQ